MGYAEALPCMAIRRIAHAFRSSESRTGRWGNSVLEQVGARDARYAAATLLIEQGVRIRVVQEILGHTRVTTTERYTHVATLQMRDASDRMDAALWGSA
jgi:site-specific recombinase XerD